MKVRMLEQITGYRNEVAWPAKGGEIELPDHEAAKLCATGRAVPVVEERVEKAVAPAAETRATPPAPRPRRKK